MTLTHRASGRLEPTQRSTPSPGPGEILIAVAACGVCRTDLHIVDGELAEAALPIVPGHEIVGRVVGVGPECEEVHVGDRVGVPWLAWACGACEYCASGRENLCARARFTGCHVDGGYADHAIAQARFCVPVPDAYDDAHAAPLLCAGLIGYRAYRMAGEARRLGIYGFGAAAHIIAQVARFQGREVFAFVTPGDEQAARFARGLGVSWAGGSDVAPPDALDAAIIFAPVGRLVPEALSHVVPGGSVVCAGIHMSDIPAFPYRLLWQERVVRSVANLTRADARDFMALAAEVPIRTHVRTYPLERANDALADLREGNLTGAAVLLPDPSWRARAETEKS
jgi:propanol-preferring alcohol dehydrogenase